MNQAQKSSKSIQKEFKESTTRQNITLSGDTILYELDDRIVAESPQGVRYEVLK